MKRAKGILPFLRLIESLLETQSSPARSLHIQVTQHSHLSPLFSTTYLSTQNVYSTYDFTNAHHQKFYFSSKPEHSIVETVVNNNWSEDLEKELEKFHSALTYETVMYVLKTLEGTPKKAFAFFNWVYDKHGVKPNSMVYGLMLRVLANKDTLKEFGDLTKRLGEEGCGVDERTHLSVLNNLRGPKKTMKAASAEWTGFYKKLVKESAKDVAVKSVADVILGLDTVDDKMTRLEELKDALSENTILRIFWALYSYPLKALWFFLWLKEDMGYKHNAVTYNAILRVLGQKGSIKEFWSMVDELKKVGHDIDVDTYAKVSNKLPRSGLMKDAVELYELMVDGPYKPQVEDCSSLLRDISMTSKPDLDLVSRVVKKYEAIQNVLSKEAYDRIYKSLIIVRKFDEANKVLDTMRNAGYVPDDLTYSHGVFGLTKAGRLEEAVTLLDKMESIGCALETRTWNTLIRGFCTAGVSDQALKCFTRMLETNSKVDTHLLEDLVSCLCNNERVDNAYTLVTELVDNPNIRPFLSTFQMLIQELLREKKFEQALNLIPLMKKHNYAPFREPYVNYISKFGTPDDAWELLKELSLEQHASRASYFRVFESFIKEDRHTEARELLDKCPDHIRENVYVVKLITSQKGEVKHAKA